MSKAELAGGRRPLHGCFQGWFVPICRRVPKMVSGLFKLPSLINICRGRRVRSAAGYLWPDRDVPGSEIREIAEFQPIILTRTDRSSNTHEVWLS